MTPTRTPIRPFAENVTEAGLACLLTMVQGNVLALGATHWWIATQTGLWAGGLATVVVWLSRIRREWRVALVLGVATTVVDAWTHPGSFGGALTEAAVTGAGAAVLSLLFSALKARVAARRAVATG